MNFFANIKSLVGNSGAIISARIVGMSLALAWMIIITRSIKVEHIGQVSLGISISSLVAMLATINLGSVAIKYIPSYLTENKFNHISGYLNIGTYTTLSITILISVSVILIYYWQTHTSSEFIPSYILLSLLSAPLLGWIQLKSSCMRAYEKVFLSVVPAFLLQPLIMLILTWLGISLKLINNAPQLMLTYIISLIIVFFTQTILFKNTLRNHSSSKADYKEFSKWVSQSLQLIVPLLFIQNATQTIIVLSGSILTQKDIAYLSVDLRIMSLLLFSVGAITMASGPRFSKEVYANNYAAVKQTIIASGLIKIVISILGCIAIIGYGEQILEIFGDGYTVGLSALIILTFVPIITAVFGPVVLFATLLNLHYHSLIIFIISILLLASLNILLGVAFGLVGAAYAVLITWLFWNASLYLVIKIKGGYDISIFSIFNYR